MSSREIVIAIASSAVGGILVWVIQQFYLNRRERKRENAQRRIRASHSDKVITDDIFMDLGPGKSIALMKEMLGAPHKFKRIENPVFSEGDTETNSYLYFFNNSIVKLTSKDNETIDTLTVFPDERLSVEGLFFPCTDRSYQFNKVKVCRELINEHTYISTIRDASFAVRYGVAAPHYLSFTYFGSVEDLWAYRESNNPDLLIGGVIEGVCVSQQGEDAFFIYDYELR